MKSPPSVAAPRRADAGSKIELLSERDHIVFATVARSSGWLAGFSRRWLQRYLAEEGTNFSVLLDDERLSLAVKLLACERHTVTEIALNLGYTESANFARAFRRWCGLSPSQYRQQIWGETERFRASSAGEHLDFRRRRAVAGCRCLSWF
jgi:AraC-like DNA-binding protein